MGRPNVVLICVDQWRGDCFSGTGHPVVTTPYLDAWMQTGTRFARAYSATPTCIPARASLMTGLGQERHGRVGYEDGVPWDYQDTLPATFAGAGYQTQAVGKMHVFPERETLGFDDVDLHDGYLHFVRRRYGDMADADDYLPWLQQRLGYPADDFEHGLHCNSVVARPWDKPESTHPTNWVTQRSIEFLRERDPDRPFFLLASYHRPHPPYDPPAWAFEQYLHQEMPAPPVGDWTDLWAEHADARSPISPVAEYDPRTLQRARAGYYGHMSHIDQQLNRLFHELSATGADNTIVCFVSDHGEQMGDHHLYQKTLPYEGSARVPFIISGPGIPAGVVDDDVVELRDVMPTLLSAAGVPVPDDLDGRDALTLVDAGSQDDAPPWREYLHGEHTKFGQGIHYLTDGRQKYIWCSGTGREQLFDLVSDPTELHDLAPGRPDHPDLRRWRDRMVASLSGRPEGFVRDGSLIAGRPVVDVLPFLRERTSATVHGTIVG
ncbi:arylsulfatase [Ruania alba]|uniref:Arylsulfatase A n=1 Tax=Ruania alba TaxID=648782 RepID=A0A1H5FYZ0_9MICO|nr:arylsulfatase [Ruania alba]SEE08643.1 Arylsulfatase A [Ruania alba]